MQSSQLIFRPQCFTSFPPAKYAKTLSQDLHVPAHHATGSSHFSPSKGVWIPQVQQFRLYFSSLKCRKFTWAPTQSIYNWLGHNVDNCSKREKTGGTQQLQVCKPSLNTAGHGGQFLMRVQLCCFVLWHLALLSRFLVLPCGHPLSFCCKNGLSWQLSSFSQQAPACSGWEVKGFFISFCFCHFQ